MGGRLLPPDWLYFQPSWINFLMNPATVQFTHRCLALTTCGTLLWLVYRTWIWELPANAKKIANAIGIAAIAQVGLGISTLLHHVPVALAAAHQAGAITVLTLVLAFLFVLRKPRAGAMLESVPEPSFRSQAGTALGVPSTQNPGWTEGGR